MATLYSIQIYSHEQIHYFALGTACHVNGQIRWSALCDELKIKPGETTETDFYLNNAACLGCCSLAPVMMISSQACGLTPDKARRIIRGIYSRGRELRRVEPELRIGLGSCGMLQGPLKPRRLWRQIKSGADVSLSNRMYRYVPQ